MTLLAAKHCVYMHVSTRFRTQKSFERTLQAAMNNAFQPLLLEVQPTSMDGHDVLGTTHSLLAVTQR